MKCYTITSEGIVEGISADIHKPKETEELIKYAEVELSGEAREGLDMADIKNIPIDRLSAVCRVELIPCKTNKPPHKSVLVAFNPVVAYQDIVAGDKSSLIFRNNYLFVCIAKPGQAVFSRMRKEAQPIICTEEGLIEVDTVDRKKVQTENTFVIRIK